MQNPDLFGFKGGRIKIGEREHSIYSANVCVEGGIVKITGRSGHFDSASLVDRPGTNLAVHLPLNVTNLIIAAFRALPEERRALLHRQLFDQILDPAQSGRPR
ncbi:hypothetical protein [Paracoccus sanguinis]|uniref:hypothetical protein n=1 Tax=Paracoccus sanguinis TaxID=1545044 RepID=UPI001451B0B5|nr:hypothetical protein [Paracoccus sanguinis]QJD17794.1 hypothetical protein HGN31_13585 [Paracoccus sanguinis]